MTAPQIITFSLYFSDDEPRIIGHMDVGCAQYQIVGIRRSDVRTDLTAHRVNGKQNEPSQESP
jgi:hypothetical protein